MYKFVELIGNTAWQIIKLHMIVVVSSEMILIVKGFYYLLQSTALTSFHILVQPRPD